MYQNGVVVGEMRVSNLHHETAIQSILIVQEIEPATWNKLQKRILGASAIKHLKRNSFSCPKELPYMFASWEEYALHLTENIVQDEKNKKQLLKIIDSTKMYYDGKNIYRMYWSAIINTILSSDWDFTKLRNFKMRPAVRAYYLFRSGRRDDDMRWLKLSVSKKTSTFTDEEYIELTEKYERLKAKNNGTV